MAPGEQPAEPMSEAQLLAAVTDLANLLGLLVYHTRDSRQSDPGFPDLVLVGRHGFLFAELKTAIGKLTSHQRTWRDWLQQAGASWYLWRPADLTSGHILVYLKAIA